MLLITNSVFAQEKKEEKATPVLLKQANELIGIEIKGEMVNKLVGNVIFNQENVWLYCDSAYQYDRRNEVECFGNVRLNQGDTIQMTGKKLKYFGNTGRAVVTNNVVLKDRQMTLTTDYLEYDTKSKLASYRGGGKIVDKENVLTSEIGYYSTASKIFWFRKNVKAENLKEKSILLSDTLEYNSNNGIATFHGPSKVIKKTDILYADHGKYDTRKAQSLFTGRAKVETNNFIMEGDRFFYDEKLKAGAATGNVICYSDSNKLIVQGDQVRYWGSEGIVKVYDKPIMKNLLEKDTLYLIADTLISIDRPLKLDTTQREKFIYAFKKAKFWRAESQGICDSLVYNMKDSVVHFFTKPTLWNAKSQVIADTIRVFLKNKTINRAECNMDAFAITQDTVLNFNQVTGKNMIAYFSNGKIHQINVKGNARTLYFPIDEKKNNQLIGMNRADCSSIVVRFKDGQFTSVTYQKKPDAKMIPPKQINEVDRTLEGFEWRSEQRPQFKEFSELRPPVAIPFIPGKELIFGKPAKDTIDSIAAPIVAKADTLLEKKIEEKPKNKKKNQEVKTSDSGEGKPNAVIETKKKKRKRSEARSE